MTQSKQHQGIAAHHERLLAAIADAKTFATVCAVEAYGEDDATHAIYADLRTSLDVMTRRVEQIRH